MKVLVFSDIHGNISAFERLLKLHTDVDQFICLGDVVNYGPYSNECVDLLDSLPENTIKLLGNHEEYFISGEYESINIVSRAFFDFCYPKFDRLESISTYINDYVDYGYTFQHTILDKYIYGDSEVDFDKNYMIGHSHRQFVIESNDNLLYNPGSIGQNRVNFNFGQYLILYPEKNLVELKSIEIDHDGFIKDLIKQDYPQVCIDYIKSKIK